MSAKLDKVIEFTADEVLGLGPAWIEILFEPAAPGARQLAAEGLIKHLLAEHFRSVVTEHPEDVTPDDAMTLDALEGSAAEFRMRLRLPDRTQILALVRSYLPAPSGNGHDDRRP